MAEAQVHRALPPRRRSGAGKDGQAMIFIQTGAMKMLILDPAALRVLEQGRAILSPDKTVGLFYSPAPEWLARKISTVANGNRLDADALRQIWEKAHGSVPRGHGGWFKDRKRDHCDLTN